MSLPSDTPQDIANVLGYLQHHLQELTERQHVSKNNINSTLAALTVQLQQLTQLVANPPPPAIPNTPPPPVPSPPVSPPPAPPVRQTHPKLSCPPDFNREHHNSHAFLNSCSLYIRLAPEQFYDEQEKILGSHVFSRMVMLPSSPRTSSIRKRTPAFSPYPPGGLWATIPTSLLSGERRSRRNQYSRRNLLPPRRSDGR